MKKITFLLCTLSLIFAGNLIGCSDAQNNPSKIYQSNPSGEGPMAIDLGTSGNFAILSKTEVDNASSSVTTGDIGISPASSTALTGFNLILDSSGKFSTSALVTLEGKLYAPNYTEPTPTKLTKAISDMELAYTDAAGRSYPNQLNLGAGEIGGLTLPPGLYKWGTDVSISNDVTLDGAPTDVWIFQIAKGITVAPGAKVILAGGALPENIFWQSAGVVALDTTSHFEGIILSQSAITMNTGASINGRLLAQTAVTLKSNTVIQP